MTEDNEEIDSVARAHFPFRVEYCKTSRARCKKCGEFMEAGTVKLANMTKSRFHDGYDANFYHTDCFFRIKRPNSVAEIGRFETLKYEDQKMLEKAVETKGRSVLNDASEDVEQPKKSKSKVKKRAPADLMNYDDFLVEYAKSSRATCIACEQKIEKATVRLGKLDFAAETPWGAGPVPRWYHVDCFAKSLEQLEFYGRVDKIEAFDELEKDDQKMLKKKIKVLQRPGVEDGTSAVKNGKKVKKEKQDEEVVDREAKEEKLIRDQSNRFFALKELVGSMKRKDIEEMLHHMNQKSDYKNTSILVDMATDVLMFGPIGKCPQCKRKGGIQLRGCSYICTLGDESAQCTYESSTPPRLPPNVPDEITDKYEFFLDGTYRFSGGHRLFSSKLIKEMKRREAEENNLVMDGAPLENLVIGLTSWKALKNDKTVVQKKVTTLGGKLVTALDSSVFVIMTNRNELDIETPKMEVAKALNIPFATDNFLLNIKTKQDVVPEISKCLIGNWSGDLQKRYVKMSAAQKGSQES